MGGGGKHNAILNYNEVPWPCHGGGAVKYYSGREMSLFKHDGSTGREMRLIRTVGIISSITRNNPCIRGALKNQKKFPPSSDIELIQMVFSFRPQHKLQLRNISGKILIRF